MEVTKSTETSKNKCQVNAIIKLIILINNDPFQLIETDGLFFSKKIVQKMILKNFKKKPLNFLILLSTINSRSSFLYAPMTETWQIIIS